MRKIKYKFLPNKSQYILYLMDGWFVIRQTHKQGVELLDKFGTNPIVYAGLKNEAIKTWNSIK